MTGWIRRLKSMNLYKSTLRSFLSEFTSSLRKSRGMTQEEMAEKLRITGRAYSDLERGIYCFSTVALIFLLLMLKVACKRNKTVVNMADIAPEMML